MVLLGMSLWFSASAVAEPLAARLGLAPASAAWLTTAVQLGFVAGTLLAALGNLADLLPARAYVAGSALLAAAANLVLLVADTLPLALASRVLVGAALAGVYPPAMKMIATWYPGRRGLAIGVIVGALTVGKATPWLVRALGGLAPEAIVLSTSACAVAAAALVGWGYADGPAPFPRRPFDARLVLAVLRDRPTRLATLGYLGHMWELYAMWTWAPAFLTASLAAWSADGGRAVPSGLADAGAFLVIAAGGAGCVWAGLASRRLGSRDVAIRCLAASGTLAAAIGLAFGAHPALLLALAAAWGFFVVADSAQFSAIVADVAPAHAVGTALTLQVSLGFLLTTVTIDLVPRLAAAGGWRWAFVPLALGPALGVLAMRRLPAVPAR